MRACLLATLGLPAPLSARARLWVLGSVLTFLGDQILQAPPRLSKGLVDRRRLNIDEV